LSLSGSRSIIPIHRSTKEEGVLPTIEQHEYAEAEPALARAAESVSTAKGEIRDLLASDRERTWTVRDIQERLSHWRGTIIHLALLDMARHAELTLGGDFTIGTVSADTL
jgi:hypothetical protein